MRKNFRKKVNVLRSLSADQPESEQPVPAPAAAPVAPSLSSYSSSPQLRPQKRRLNDELTVEAGHRSPKSPRLNSTSGESIDSGGGGLLSNGSGSGRKSLPALIINSGVKFMQDTFTRLSGSGQTTPTTTFASPSFASSGDSGRNSLLAPIEELSGPQPHNLLQHTAPLPPISPSHQQSNNATGSSPIVVTSQLSFISNSFFASPNQNLLPSQPITLSQDVYPNEYINHRFFTLLKHQSLLRFIMNEEEKVKILGKLLKICFPTFDKTGKLTIRVMADALRTLNSDPVFASNGQIMMAVESGEGDCLYSIPNVLNPYSLVPRHLHSMVYFNAGPMQYHDDRVETVDLPGIRNPCFKWMY